MIKDKFEQTLVLIKPDAIKNSLTGYVLSQLSEYHTGLHFAAVKIVNISTMLAKEHYKEHVGKPYFPALLNYITGRVHYPRTPWKRRLISIVFQGKDAIKKIRKIAGPTNPHIARVKTPGSIRTLGTVVTIKNKKGIVLGDRMDNLIHASNNKADAEREIKLWFKPNDMPPFMQVYETMVCREHYYIKDDKLFTDYEPGRVCVLAPGDVTWKSDFESLKDIIHNRPSSISLEAVVAKYLINERPE